MFAKLLWMWILDMQVLDVNNTGKLDAVDLMELFPYNSNAELLDMLRDNASAHHEAEGE